MPYPDKALKNHPGANPHRGQHGECGQFRGFYRHPNFRGGKERYVGLADASRWVPHFGAKEAAKYAVAAPHRLGGA